LFDQLAQQCFIEFSDVDALDCATTIYERCHRHALSWVASIGYLLALASGPAAVVVLNVRRITMGALTLS